MYNIITFYISDILYFGHINPSISFVRKSSILFMYDMNPFILQRILIAYFPAIIR